ncbi:lipopolysaccharide heptosyltransferase I [Hahella ganghwensis]|uniref:lipopolysaccharide heptosyltransferase I n=1 Tax=Hahella ganghwensis TaxID=286420 RepID=UPI000370C676|nr:lipopolysaccharide heptosyltransferase I [Hahella ganghwensis]
MRILLIKMSSLGDVIHTLPAVTDAKSVYPSLVIDWVVEEGVAEIPQWHPGVDDVIPVALRRWKKQPRQALHSGEWASFKSRLAARDYDLVIDAQGLLKSAILGLWVNAPMVGYDARSIREPAAALLYGKRFAVSRRMHAVERIRELFALSLGYSLDVLPLNYGFSVNPMPVDRPYVVFLHGTTWSTKHWPEKNWRDLAIRCAQAGLGVRVVWGNEEERLRAERLGEVSGVEVMPKMSLKEVAGVLQGAKAVVSVDTGLGHLAAALDRPLVALYGPTSAELTGIYGPQQISLSGQYHCAPCMKRQCRYDILAQTRQGIDPPCWQNLSVSYVWSTLKSCL